MQEDSCSFRMITGVKASLSSAFHEPLGSVAEKYSVAAPPH